MISIYHLKVPLSQNKSLYLLGLEREIVMQNYGTLCHQIKSQVSGLSCHRIVLNWQISSFRGFRKIRPIPKYRGTFFSRFCNGRKINIPLFLLLLSRILREMKYAQSFRCSCIVSRISVAGRISRFAIRHFCGENNATFRNELFFSLCSTQNSSRNFCVTEFMRRKSLAVNP